MVVQPDGKMLIGGNFDRVNTVSRTNIARLNADGSLDTTFQNGMAGASGLVQAIALQSNGSVLIGGYFYTINGVGRDAVARLLDDSNNQAPTAANDTLATTRNQSVSVPMAKLLARASDPEGGTLSVSDVGNPAHGTVTLVNDLVTYTPATDYTGTDSFTFSIIDPSAAAASGTMSVTVNASSVVSLNVVSPPAVTNSEFSVKFAGIPGETYTIEGTSSLAPPVIWTKKVNVSAPADNSLGFGVGVFEFRENTANADSGYYRTVHPAY